MMKNKLDGSQNIFVAKVTIFNKDKNHRRKSRNKLVNKQLKVFVERSLIKEIYINH